MKNSKKLLGLPLALGAVAIVAQPSVFGVGDESDVLPVLVSDGRGTPDPRLDGLTAGPGGVPAGSEIARLAERDDLFAEGLALFDKAFHAADGLGAPEMNADSCRGCHQDPVIGGAGGLELNVSRFGDDGYGAYPFQNLPGGQGLSKLHPPFIPGREEYDPATATVFEQRQTPTILGAGLIDTISDAVIMSNEDPYDMDGNGIFGVARRLTVAGGQEIGRFGWKAQVPRLRDFVMDAMGGELGVTTPDDGRGFAMLADNDTVPDPELSPNEVTAMHHFLANLPAPKMKVSDQSVAQGETLFTTIGCAICHVPTLQGSSGPVHLFSNLLLHDVMPPAFRGMAEPGADVGMYRTPPLWGISDTAPYMHDGRAETLRDAITEHFGEASGVVLRYQQLTQAEQDELIKFLEHL